MRIGVAVATFNEGPDLDVTLAIVNASVPPAHQLHVVDDASTLPIRTSSLALAGQITINEHRLGSGATKRRALRGLSAECDALVVLDAHMRMPWDWLTQIEKTLTAYPDALCCPTCRGFESDGAFIAAGANFTKNLLAPEPAWAPRGSEPMDNVPCVMGACYFAMRDTWEAIDFFNPAFYGWGAEEQDASLRAWLCGKQVIRNNHLIVQHNFRRTTTGFALNSWHPQYNAMVMCATLFEDGKFEELYQPFMMRHFSPDALKAFEERRDIIAQVRRHWRPRAVVSDDSLEKLCGWSHHTAQEQEDKLTPKLSSKSAKEVKPPPPSPHIGAAHRDAIVKAARERAGYMLEWGVGGSTLLFRSAGVSLMSYEHDITWASRIGGDVITVKAPGASIGNFALEECLGGSEPVLTHAYASAPISRGTKFNVILVDGVLRNACLFIARSLLHDDGVVFLHDAQRDWYHLGKSLFDWTNLGQADDYPGPELWVGRPKSL